MIKQCTIIFGCLFVGEIVVFVTGIKIPASIIGMLLLTGLLKLKIVKLQQVKTISEFLISNIAFFFIPPGVAIMLYYDVLKNELVAIFLSSILSTVLVLAITGWVYQKAMKKDE